MDDPHDEQPTEESGLGQQVRFWLSLPERTLRSGTGVVAGALRESAALLVPRSFQDSQTYTVFVRQMLDFIAEGVGGVAPRAGEAGASQIDGFVARKTVGNFLELASLATLHLSPLTILAVFSDVAYGSQVYLEELAAELKRQGVIDENSRVHHASDLLAAVAEASRTTATAFNTPPLSVEGLKQTIDEARSAASGIRPAELLPEADIRRMWDQMRELAQREDVNLLTLSGAVTMQTLSTLGTLSRGALSGVRVTRALVDQHIVNHYSEALTRIRTAGLYSTLSQTCEPYLTAVWKNFSPTKSTITEELLSGKLTGSASTNDPPLAKSPDATSQEPGSQEPGSQEPGSQEPGSQEPRSQEPGSQEPGSQEPGSQEPGSQEPRSQEPGSQEPGSQEPGSQEPGSQEPRSGQPAPHEPAS